MKIDYHKYKNIHFDQRQNCLVCGSLLKEPTIELPAFPVTEVYTDEIVKESIGFIDQGFQFCDHCCHGQIKNVIDIDLQYGESFSYHFRTSQSKSGSESANVFIAFVNSIIHETKFRKIIEIGSNDLYVLKALREKGDELVGIDPILKGQEKDLAEDKMIVIGDYFENVEIDMDQDLILCKDTLEHVNDPRNFIEKIVNKSTDKTLFIFEFPILDTMLRNCRFDHIFHQHLNYFTLKSVNYLLNEIGCSVVKYMVNQSHWGTLLVAFKKGTSNLEFKESKSITSDLIIERYSLFKDNMALTTRRLDILKDETVYGYGAALMLPVLGYHLKTDFSSLKCVIDDDEQKEGLYYINLPVSIKSSKRINDIEGSNILITAISSVNNVRWILHRLFSMKPKQIILPLNII